MINATGTPVAKPNVLLYQQTGPALVPMTSAEVRKDEQANAAKRAATTTLKWFEHHLGDVRMGTASHPVRIALQSGLNNAYWDESSNLLALGTSRGSTPSFATLDVVAHELAHALQPKGHQYAGEAGAVSESVADVVAEVIDGGDWKLGGEVVKGGLRDLAAPAVSHLSNTTASSSTYDLAGLSSLAAVRSAKVLGNVDTARLWWNTAAKLGATPTLRSLAEATVANARSYWGNDTQEAQAVRDAWVSVGVLK